MEFGKNRVQYKDFLWTYYQYDSYDVYFYRNGRELAQYTSRYVYNHLRQFERLLDANLENKIQFIVFNTLSDLKQTNIRLLQEESYNVGGVTHIIGRKVFLYFNGDITHFTRQIRSGMARTLINQTLYGSSIGSQVKNNTLYTLPEWYIEGLVSFLSREWSTDMDNRLRDGFRENRYKNFNHLNGQEAIYAGHSLWKFLADRYGKSILAEIIYMTKVSRDVEDGFLYVLGISYKELIKEWRNYFENQYNQLANNRDIPQGNTLLNRFKDDRVYRQAQISPDGRYAVFETNEIGRHKVWLHDMITGKKDKLFKKGFRLNEKVDYTYPLFSWHPSGKLFAMITEQKGEIYLYFYNIEEESQERRILYDFEKIRHIAYSPDGTKFLLSAVRKGQSDLYLYDIPSNSFEQLTDDLFNDLDPRFLGSTGKLIFRSNRVNDTLRFDQDTIPWSIAQNHDLFIYDYESHDPVLKRVTRTPLADEKQPRHYKENFFSYLSDANGIYNRYIGRLDSAITYVDTITHYRYFTETFPATNYSHNITYHHVAKKAGKITEIIYHKGEYKIYSRDLILPQYLEPHELAETAYSRQQTAMGEKEKKKAKIDLKKQKKRQPQRGFKNLYRKKQEEEKPKEEEKRDKINIDDYEIDKQQFIRINETPADSLRRISQSLKQEMDRPKPTKRRQKSGKPKGKPATDTFEIPKARLYGVEYSINRLVNQVDFTYLNQSYQPYMGGNTPSFQNPGFNGLFKVGINDLFENYRITGGVRLNSTLVNNEYVLSFANLRNRINREIIFHRQGYENSTQQGLNRYLTHEIHYVLSYPFNRAMRLDLTGTLRNDRLLYIGLNPEVLGKENENTNWGRLKLEFVFDATRKLDLNLYDGLRYKVFGEYYQQVDQVKENMIVLGADFRYYKKIHRTFIWANRLAGSTSFGANRLIYYLGGVDNWITPKFNQDAPVDQDQNFAYQTLATNMRGFNQNVRNGNNFAVINTELRFPLFRYFFNRPIKSGLLNHFQIVGFGDIGTAWNGWDPYSEKNTLFTNTISKGPLRITLEEYKEPIVMGYGVGARTKLLGYFIRGDLAWGVEDGKIKEPQLYISLSMDF
ncbi:MAG: hypothetical protein K9I94_08535 [Bacteroidales bacterium]|nr:hypothetical protein [Bacteroidales bacterium]